jgi:hypothetical protein
MLEPKLHLVAAFTTIDRIRVDADVARARHLVLIDITATQSAMIEVRDPRRRLPDGAGLLFTLGLADSAALRLARAGTFPVVLEHSRPIESIVDRLQALIRHDPPLWLCRRLRTPTPCLMEPFR